MGTIGRTSLGQHGRVQKREPGWVFVIVVFSIATLVPVVFIAIAVAVTHGVTRIAAAAIGIGGLAVILPFLPPVIRGDHVRVNAMIERRRRSKGQR